MKLSARTRRHAIALLSAGSLFAFAQPALAQDNGADGANAGANDEGGDIVVTARRRE